MAGLTGATRQRYVADLFVRISGHYDLMNDVMTLGCTGVGSGGRRPWQLKH